MRKVQLFFLIDENGCREISPKEECPLREEGCTDIKPVLIGVEGGFRRIRLDNDIEEKNSQYGSVDSWAEYFDTNEKKE